jgi:hypothetical protein
VSFSKLQWMDAVRQCTDIAAERRTIIMHIGATADQYGNDAWRDNETVAAELKVSTRTVTRALEDAAKHLLWMETRPADNKHTARYRLIMPSSWGGTTVHPNEFGVTPQTAGVDTTVRLGVDTTVQLGDTTVYRFGLLFGFFLGRARTHKHTPYQNFIQRLLVPP